MVRLLLRFLLPALLLLPVAAGAAGVRVARVEGSINPATAAYVRGALHEASARRDLLFLLEIDTPGGLDEAMRGMVKEFLSSPVPVAVFVAPSGARAASAGAVIGISADILAMAPGTNIGAAHPVSLGQKPDAVMEKKVVNDAAAYVAGLAEKRGRSRETARRMVTESLSLPAAEAASAGIADLLASDRADLLAKLEGRRVVRGGRQIVLKLAGAAVVEERMSFRQRVLNALADPNIAYLLMMAGLIGIFFELSNPGAILPGVVGGIAIVLALFAFQTLPVNYAGVILIVLAALFFIAEIHIISHGMLAVAGTVALLLGSLMLFDSAEPSMKVSLAVVLPVVGMTALFCIFAVTMAVKAHRRRPATGVEGLPGETGTAVSVLTPDGKVFVRGEYWDAVAEEPVAQGEKVRVVGVEGMKLRVAKLVAPQAETGSGGDAHAG